MREKIMIPKVLVLAGDARTNAVGPQKSTISVLNDRDFLGILLGNLSKGVFEQRTSTESEAFSLLTLQVPMVTNINFLLMISIHFQEIWLRELIKWSPK